jgi:hypothetical protein
MATRDVVSCSVVVAAHESKINVCEDRRSPICVRFRVMDDVMLTDDLVGSLVVLKVEL